MSLHPNDHNSSPVSLCATFSVTADAGSQGTRLGPQREFIPRETRPRDLEARGEGLSWLHTPMMMAVTRPRRHLSQALRDSGHLLGARQGPGVRRRQQIWGLQRLGMQGQRPAGRRPQHEAQVWGQGRGGMAQKARGPDSVLQHL